MKRRTFILSAVGGLTLPRLIGQSKSLPVGPSVQGLSGDETGFANSDHTHAFWGNWEELALTSPWIDGALTRDPDVRYRFSTLADLVWLMITGAQNMTANQPVILTLPSHARPKVLTCVQGYYGYTTMSGSFTDYVCIAIDPNGDVTARDVNLNVLQQARSITVNAIFRRRSAS